MSKSPAADRPGWYRFISFAIVCTMVLAGCSSRQEKFVKHDPDKTGIRFTNTIQESDSINIFDFANVYNGGGIGAGDFNNDGLTDLYFTGNMVSNKLYLNKGNFRFEDITVVSKTDGGGAWSRGVTVVDINNDGLKDIYVCATAKRDPAERVNLLYINQGLNAEKKPVFRDMAEEYGLADTSQSTMAYFFDYDNDTDLDLYIAVNHIIKDEYANTFRPRNLNGQHPSTGRLYRNEWNDTLKHPVFKNVSREAGILVEGYSHAADIFDVNKDGWLDILVLNDYISGNVLYINNRNGTFTDRVSDYFKHGAANSMGSDAVDINNDGLVDVIEVDMAPQDNLRKKMFQPPVGYQIYQNTEQFGYQYQYTRNMVQLNLGPFVSENDIPGHPVFADAGYFAGIAETDWSWTPLAADYDNDGLKDILFTNGFPKDITDRDFMTYRDQAYSLTSKKDMLGEIPAVRIHNYVYKNENGLQFSDQTRAWGLEAPSFSNGAVYADLDNDGDLDVVINNIDDPAAVYENRIVSNTGEQHYLKIKCRGPAANRDGIGAVLQVFQQGTMQLYNNNPFRGYISSVPDILHIGLGKNTHVDSVVVTWPGRLRQKITGVNADQLLSVDFSQAVQDTADELRSPSESWFSNITGRTGISYVHSQRDFVDFNIQKLLPHKLSEYSPGIATGDINGDGLDDFITGGVSGSGAVIFFQDKQGRFSQQPLLTESEAPAKQSEDRGLLLFDADNDNDLDLYIAAGGYQYESGTAAYSDMFYRNNGKGRLTPDTSALPYNRVSKFCVRAVDYDKDGDLDLFVAGRVDPHAYPRPVSSFIYRNDSKPGEVHFTDVTAAAAPALLQAGLVCDGLFTDYDNDGWMDLVLAGEWMPVKLLHNEKGLFVDQTEQAGLQSITGWWNTLSAGDFDNDGDMDYIAGNLGLNSFFRASKTKPVNIYAADFDKNGSYDAIPALYLINNMESASWQEYPAYGRDDMIKQILGTRREFPDYKSYGEATMNVLLPEVKRNGMLKYSANEMASVYIRNEGNGKFSVQQLPLMAQLSVLNGIVTDDFDGDGNLDVAFSTNEYGMDPAFGRQDALNGMLLKGNGNGQFTSLSMWQSGLFINGCGRGLAKLAGADSSYRIAATLNKGPLQLYRLRKTPRIVKAAPADSYAIIEMKEGRKQRYEFSYGSSFLSQGSRFLVLPENAISCFVYNTQGKSRRVK